MVCWPPLRETCRRPYFPLSNPPHWSISNSKHIAVETKLSTNYTWADTAKFTKTTCFHQKEPCKKKLLITVTVLGFLSYSVSLISFFTSIFSKNKTCLLIQEKGKYFAYLIHQFHKSSKSRCIYVLKKHWNSSAYEYKIWETSFRTHPKSILFWACWH